MDKAGGDILRGGSPAANKPGRAGSGTRTPAATDAARANAKDTLARTTRTLASIRAMQAAARQNALKNGVNNLGKTDYVHSVALALAHVRPLRDFFLRAENYAPRCAAADFIAVNHFMQAAAGTLFFSLRIATLPLAEGGRVTLLNGALRRRGPERLGDAAAAGAERARDAGDLRRLAREHFGIELSEAQARALFAAEGAAAA